MKREDLRVLIRALRDLDREDGHQPLADIVAREFKRRPDPTPRCPNCRGPITGWMAGAGGQVVWCTFCTTFEEASAFLSERAQEQREARRAAILARREARR